jgi:MoxR-like ATPase
MNKMLDQLIKKVGEIILGKPHQIRLIFSCLLAKGHVLIEDIPGVGKTTLAHALAQVLGLNFQRIQFTSDLLPADILGVSIYDRETAKFKFHEGAIFTQMLLADEVNRATPKTQSALLEAMEERQVTIDGETRILPQPFFVLATQNPLHQIGTFPLPESQLDRFMMRISLGYPNAEAEKELLKGKDRRVLIQNLEKNDLSKQIIEWQATVPQIIVRDPLIHYVQAILQHTRQSPDYKSGLSPRAGLAMLRSAQAWAMLSGRDFVIPEDIQSIMSGVINHRLSPTTPQSSEQLATRLIEQVPIP